MSDLYLDGFKCSASQMLVLDMVIRTLRESYRLKPFRLPGLTFQELSGGAKPVKLDEPYSYRYVTQRFMARSNISFGSPTKKAPIAMIYERTYGEHLPSNSPSAYRHKLYIAILVDKTMQIVCTNFSEETDSLTSSEVVSYEALPFELQSWFEGKV